MNATISLEGLWSIVNSLSTKNKKWLANKLNEALAPASQSKDEATLSAISKSLNEAKNGQTMPIDSLWEQLYPNL
ncbi:MAG: hypothetical protein HDT00_00770 [Bacteroidales bacterium]|nr:hypothetical protein [Bacteroidales bacterium]MDE6222074.1 hypothetical protein [Muribaculaceae bacterium]